MGLCLFKDDWPQSFIQFDSLIIQIDGIDDQLVLSEQSHFILLHRVKPFLQQKKTREKYFLKKIAMHCEHISSTLQTYLYFCWVWILFTVISRQFLSRDNHWICHSLIRINHFCLRLFWGRSWHLFCWQLWYFVCWCLWYFWWWQQWCLKVCCCLIPGLIHFPNVLL